MRAHSKIGFRKWIELEQLKSQMIEAAEGGDFPDRVFAFLSAASKNVNENKGWKDTMLSVTEVKYPQPKGIPLLDAAPKGGKEADWSYPKRDWYYYSHLLASIYGWTLEYISDLEVEEAFGHIQEILTDDHLEKEFYYSLSEVAYRYNKSTKKSDFVPMKRPYWMKPVAPKEIKKMRIRRDLLPVGYIKDISGLPAEFSIPELNAEKVDAPRSSPPV